MKYELYPGIIFRVGQNPIYRVYIRYVWQGNHQIYGHMRYIYTVLANPNDMKYELYPGIIFPTLFVTL
jgi:hypothetical protein